jgi:methylmalonyl-CoA/ethylmalonyl-CoA epimerase
MREGLQFHHVGVACTDLDSEEARMAPLGYRREREDFTDPIQGVLGRFLGTQSPRLELLCPMEGAGVLTPWLKSGAKLYHLAYETVGLETDIERLRGEGAKVVVPPVGAVAFGGRRIAFLMLPNRLLLELIEWNTRNDR